MPQLDCSAIGYIGLLQSSLQFLSKIALLLDSRRISKRKTVFESCQICILHWEHVHITEVSFPLESSARRLPSRVLCICLHGYFRTPGPSRTRRIAWVMVMNEIDLCIYIFIYNIICICVYICICLCVYVCVCMCVCVYVCVYVCMCVCVYVCMCMCVYTYLYIYAFIYLFIYV